MAVAAVAACTGPIVEYEGEHVVIGADPELEPCAGTIPHMDEFIARLSTEFGREPPTGEERIRFRWLRESDYAETSCTPGSYGCTSGDRIYSWQAPINHELVHALVSPLGRPPSFFVEGLAHAYEGLGRDDTGTRASAAQIMPSLAGDSGVPRATAGAFVAHLVEHHGIDALLRLYEEMPRSASVGRIDRLFGEIFGVTLAASITEFEKSYEGCFGEEYDAKIIECAAPEIEWEAGRVVVFRSLACEEPDAVGPYDGRRLRIFYTLVIPGDGEYEINVIGDSSDEPGLVVHRVDLNPCGSCGSGSGVSISAGERTRITLAAGRHSLRLNGPAATTTTIGFTLTPVDDGEEQP